MRLRSVFRPDATEFNDRFTRGERQLRVIRDLPVTVFAKPERPRLSLERPTHRVTNRTGEQATTNPIMEFVDLRHGWLLVRLGDVTLQHGVTLHENLPIQSV